MTITVLNVPLAEHAYLEAYEAAAEMWGELLRKRNDPRRCAFDIRDPGGNVLFELSFTEVLDGCNDRSDPSKVAGGPPVPQREQLNRRHEQARLSVLLSVTESKQLYREARRTLRVELDRTREHLRESARLMEESRVILGELSL